MIGYKQVLCTFFFTTVLVATILAQNNTNSPYTRYGYGQLSDHSFGKSIAMGGIGYGLRDYTQINVLNPASYSMVDSLTFLFDGGITLQNTNFSDGATKINVKNSSVDYIAMQFRLIKGIGVTAGLLPYANVGYNVSKADEHPENTDANNITTYAGEGGLHQLFLGVGGYVTKNLSIGANISYLWGSTNRSTSLYFPASTVASNGEQITVSVKDIKLDFGAQYRFKLAPKRELTIGAVFSPKQNLNNSTTIINTETINGSTSLVASKDSIATFGIPNRYGFGATYTYDNRLLFGIDYTMEKWGDVSYFNQPNAFSDRSKISVGAEYRPSLTSRYYLSHVKYRLGGYYSTPYYKIKGEKAAREYGVTFGLGLPIPKTRSVLNISAQYVKVDGLKSSLLDENYLKLNIGITFNEVWFRKRKVY
jgi:hypothetical protein